jgi:adhesin transport system membrane fusion protein
MNELEAATYMRPSLASNILLGSIASLFVLFILWASLSHIEELTRGSGQVVPSQEIQVVQSLEGGILEELLVSEGDRVNAGQILMKISDILFASEERGVEARYVGLRARKIRLEAEAQGKEFILPDDIARQAPDIMANENALYESRQEELKNAFGMLDEKIKGARAEIEETEEDIKRIINSRTLLKKELSITQEMVKQKAVPKLEEIRLQREVSELSGQHRGQEKKLERLQAALSAAEKEYEDQHDRFRTQALGELSEVESEIAQLEENLKSIGDRVDRTEVRSPVSGVINNIALTTIGGVVEPAHKLVEIVPIDDELKIIARVRPSDIAFLVPGQDVKVKISAYDPQRYGSLDGKLIRIGANSVNDNEGNIFFEIEVRTEKNYLGTDDNPLPITPGMVAETEVITGDRTIMEYLMKPILRARSRAFTER